MKYLILLSLFIVGCSTQQGRDIDKHQQFLTQVEAHKRQLKGKEYKNYLMKMVSHKQDEMKVLKSMIKKAEIQSAHQDQTARTLDDRHYDFQADRSRQNLQQISDRVKVVESEIFFLNAELSSLEEKGF